MTFWVKIGHFAILVSDWLMQAFFPCFCVNCGSENNLKSKFLCQNCFELIEEIKTDCCPKCGRLSSNGKYCKSCGRKSKLSGIVVSAKYDGPIKELVHYLKYSKMQIISKYLAKLMVKKLSGCSFKGEVVVVPVPLYFLRKFDRGFNQSELLAKEICKKMGLPLSLVLKRVRNTSQQMKLNRPNRLQNLQGAFRCKNPENIVGKTILLVDDVTTTGATLNECAKTLKSAGARQVFGVVVAKR